MRLVFCILLCASAVTWCADIPVNINDYVLKSYRLTSGQEAQFRSDGIVSPFWRNWDSANTDTANVVYDYVHLTPAVNSWVDGANVFSGDQDADMSIRSAYGAKGLYLYFGIIDNVWVPPAGFAADGVDFLLDKLSSQTIRDTNPYDLYIQPSWGWTLTYYTIQYQVNIGVVNGQLASYVNINYFTQSAMSYKRVNLAQLDSGYDGLSVDLISTGVNRRVLEMYIPWTWVGCGGGVGMMPAYGKLIALQLGYNDSDTPTQTGSKSLRWKLWEELYGILGYGCSKMPPNYDYICDNWGDILIGSSLDNPTSVSPQHRPVSKTQVFTKSNNYRYDLQGRKIAASALKHSGLSCRVTKGTSIRLFSY